jgi:hypothetical protein
MDHEKMFGVFVEKIGKDELSRIMGRRIGGIIFGQMCPSSFGLPIVERCGYSPQSCRRCWAKALGMEEEV